MTCVKQKAQKRAVCPRRHTARSVLPVTNLFLVVMLCIITINDSHFLYMKSHKMVLENMVFSVSAFS